MDTMTSFTSSVEEMLILAKVHPDKRRAYESTPEYRAFITEHDRTTALYEAFALMKDGRSREIIRMEWLASLERQIPLLSAARRTSEHRAIFGD